MFRSVVVAVMSALGRLQLSSTLHLRLPRSQSHNLQSDTVHKLVEAVVGSVEALVRLVAVISYDSNDHNHEKFFKEFLFPILKAGFSAGAVLASKDAITDEGPAMHSGPLESMVCQWCLSIAQCLVKPEGWRPGLGLGLDVSSTQALDVSQLFATALRTHQRADESVTKDGFKVLATQMIPFLRTLRPFLRIATTQCNLALMTVQCEVRCLIVRDFC